VVVVEVVVTVVDVVSATVVVVSGTEVVVVVSGAVVVVVTMFAQRQPSRHAVNAPPGESGGQVSLPGGSHCSTPSTVPLPQTGDGAVVVVVVTVVVVDAATVVVVVTWLGSQMHVALHSVKEPSGELAGQVKLPGGSQSSPLSITSLPQTARMVVVVVVVLVVVVGTDPPSHAAAVVRPVRTSSAAKVPTRSAPLLARNRPDGAQTNAWTRACRRIETEPYTRNRTSHAVMSAPGVGPICVALLVDTSSETAIVTGPLASSRPRRERRKLQNT
jgi:hypothetical protein